MDTTAWLKQHHPAINVLALSMEGNESLIRPVLDIGAAGYILKTISLEELEIALKKVLTRGYYFSPAQRHIF
jgi:DNA-binding NarL/FixJ family response regulator